MKLFKAALLIAVCCTCAILCKGDSVTASDIAFFEEVKRSVLTEDVKWFSGALSYPVTLKSQKGDIQLKNPGDVKKNASLIFTPEIKAALRAQSPQALFKNWQGVMVGDGQLWFAEVAEKSDKGKRWVYRITALNSPKAAGR